MVRPCRSCGSAAEWVVLWPGSTGLMCERCARKARGVAEAMGFDLQAMPVSVYEGVLEELLKHRDAVQRLTGEKPPEQGQGES